MNNSPQTTNKNHQLFQVLILLFSVGILFPSCFSTRQTKYFYDIKDTTVASGLNNQEYYFQPNDVLSINLTSLNEEATKVFNAPNNSTINTANASGGSAPINGYLINIDGNITMPIIGQIKAAGVTKKQLTETITKIITDKKLLIDPIVTIRHLNYEVTVLGEVGKPTVITVPNERITIFKALGLAGDITIYGNKENVLLIREKDGKKKVTKLDLNSASFFTSPYYYLQPNDVIYVESNKNKIAGTSKAVQLIPTFLSTASFIFVIASKYIK